MKMTINESMVLCKAIRGRIAELSSIRAAVSTRETLYYGNDNKRVVDPQYDVKAVDRKIVELQNFLLNTESKIKQSNAIIMIEVEADINNLLAPLV